MKINNKIKIGIILIILIIPITLAVTGTRSLTSEIGYMCENGKYQIIISPTTGYVLEEILSQDWRFASLEGDAVPPECAIQEGNTRAVCGGIVSGTRTLIFNVLNAPGTFSNVFSNDKTTGSWADNTLDINPVIVKAKNICSPDNDGDKYPSSPITNVCGCASSTKDCCDTGDEVWMGCSDETKASMYPGATEIAGDGIDQDCNGADVLLASTIYRDLPETVSEDVEFEVILNIDYSGEEDNLVIDERFDEDLECSAPDSNGVCSNGKVRWVITNPAAVTQLKYSLTPTSQKNCYDFSAGKYLFETRSEQEIKGDYAISMNDDTDCFDCFDSTPPVEECGNDVDEDCDGDICITECECSGTECNPLDDGTICDGCDYVAAEEEGETFGNCNDGIDNDCNGEKDWDTAMYAPDPNNALTRGPIKGDFNCAVGVTAISVSNPNPYVNSNIDVYCTTTVGNINSIRAFIGTSECDGDSPGSSWNGNTYTFKDCNAGSTGIKTVKCTIDTSKSYQSGEDKTMQITVQDCECSGTECNPLNNGKKCNGCYYIDVSGTENEEALNCNNNINDDCDIECDYDGCTDNTFYDPPQTFSHGDDGCPVDII